jgi:hypothetical protein
MRALATVIILVIVVAAGWFVWQQMHRPLTPGEKFDNATNELQHGTLGGAIDEVTAKTPADRVENKTNEAIDRAQGQ